MSVRTLDLFTFMFMIDQEKGNLANRNAFLDEIRTFVNTIDSFTKSKIVIKPRRIGIINDDFYFAFDSKGLFSMGFTCSLEKIEELNNVMNDISARLTKRIRSTNRTSIEIFSTAEYIINDKFDIFSKLIQNQNLGNICRQYGLLLPKKVDLECGEVKAGCGGSFDMSLFIDDDEEKEERQRKLRIKHWKFVVDQFPIDAAKNELKVITEMGNKISEDLLKG